MGNNGLIKSIKKIEIRTRRVRLANGLPSPTLNTPACVRRVAEEIMAGEDQEVFLAFFLNVLNELLGYQECHRGTVDKSLVDPRVVFRAAIVIGASSMIVVHNHPSGDPTPSASDLTITQRLVNSGHLLGVAVLDHLIIGEGKYHSFSEAGGMPSPAKGGV